MIDLRNTSFSQTYLPYLKLLLKKRIPVKNIDKAFFFSTSHRSLNFKYMREVKVLIYFIFYMN